MLNIIPPGPLLSVSLKSTGKRKRENDTIFSHIIQKQSLIFGYIDERVSARVTDVPAAEICGIIIQFISKN